MSEDAREITRAGIRDLLKRVVEIFDDSAVPFMIAGSFASTYYGVPRTTYDVDIVIAPTRDALAAFLARLPDTEYYVDADNVIDMATGWKVVRCGPAVAGEGRQECVRGDP